MRHRRLLLLLSVAVGCAGQLETATVEVVAGRRDVTVLSYRAHVAGGLSDELGFELPDGVGAALVEIAGASGQFKLAELQTPSGVDVVESGGFMTRDAREVDGLVDWLYPNSPSLRLSSGRHKLRFTALAGNGVVGDEDVTVRLYTRTGAPAAGSLKIDLFVADDALDGDPAALGEALIARLGALYAQASLTIADYTVGPLHVVGRPTAAQLRAAGARADALHVAIVGSLDDGSQPIAGYALGLPGPFAADRPTAAVLVSAASFVSPSTGTLDLAAMAVTLAHEIGHYLGLYHTSERDGLQHDPIADTPECDRGTTSCPDAGNIMFWTGGAARSKLTAGQAAVMRMHPLVQAAAPPPPPVAECRAACAPPQTCVVLGGASSCAVACDPRGEPCARGQCRPSDDGTFVCREG